MPPAQSTRVLLLITLAFTMVLLSGSLAAAEDDNLDSLLAKDLDITELLQMQVTTAARKNQTIRNAPSNIITITRQMIKDRGYQNLTQLLQDIPGFDISVGQPAGEYPSNIVFRGISDVGQTKLMLMVDGVIQNDISNGWIRNLGYDFLFIDVERIEFISGPGSALYGADAYAGVINVITRKPEDILGKDSTKNGYVEANLQYGMYNTFSPEILGAWRFNDGPAFYLAGRWFTTEGDRGVGRYDPGNYWHNNREPILVNTTENGLILNETLPGGKTRALPDGFNTSVNDWYLRGKLTDDNIELGFNMWIRDEGLSSHVVGYEYFANTESIPYNAHHSGWTFYGDYRFELNKNLGSETRVYYRETNIHPGTQFLYTYQYQSVDNGTDSAVKDKAKSYRGAGHSVGGIQTFNWRPVSSNEMLFGMQVEKQLQEYFSIALGQTQDENTTITSSTYTSEDESVSPLYFTDRYAFFIQDEQKLGRYYSLIAGARFDYHSRYLETFNPRVGILGHPLRPFHFKVLYGEAFKGPTIFELYDEWRGNDVLKPEKIRTTEVELGYAFSKTVFLQANLFHSRLENLIVVARNTDYAVGSKKANTYQNVGLTNISGSTLSIKTYLFDDLYIYSDYTLLRGEDLTEPLDNVAEHKVNVGLNLLAFKHLNINARLNWVGDVRAPRTNRYYWADRSTAPHPGYAYTHEKDPDGLLDGYYLVNLTLTGKNLLNGPVMLEPYIIIRNLLDTSYATMGRQSGDGLRPVDQPSISNPAGFSPPYHPQPGFEIYFGLRGQL